MVAAIPLGLNIWYLAAPIADTFDLEPFFVDLFLTFNIQACLMDFFAKILTMR